MYNHEPKDYECPLCALSSGWGNEITNQDDVIYHDDFLTAFIAGKWWRKNKGHVIIIPNKHVENLYDISDEDLARVQQFAKKVAIALRITYKCDGTSLRQHNEPAGNQDVFHYHLHVFPRYKNDKLYQNHEDKYWPEQSERIVFAKKLKEYFLEKNK